MNKQELQHFTNALLDLGRTDLERSKRLGVPLRTFMDYKAGRLPQGMRRLMSPQLLRALAEDAERQQTTTHDPFQAVGT